MLILSSARPSKVTRAMAACVFVLAAMLGVVAPLTMVVPWGGTGTRPSGPSLWRQRAAQVLAYVTLFSLVIVGAAILHFGWNDRSGGLLVGLGGAMLLAAYFLFAWLTKGRSD
jgi:hypothetical protein